MILRRPQSLYKGGDSIISLIRLTHEMYLNTEGYNSSHKAILQPSQYLSHILLLFFHQSNETMSGYRSDVVTRFSLWASAMWLLTRFYEIQPRSTLLLSGEIVSSWVVVNEILICYRTLYKRHYSPFNTIPGPKVCFVRFLGRKC